MLDIGVRVPLTIVSAPAGFGKTTVLSTWTRTQHIPVARLTLEESDNDPASNPREPSLRACILSRPRAPLKDDARLRRLGQVKTC